MFLSDYEKLDHGINKYYERHFSKKMKKLQTQLLVKSDTIDNVTVDFTQFQISQLKLDELIALSVISWYTPEEIGYLLRLWLMENWGSNYKEVEDIVLTSKRLALGYLLVQNRFSNNDFFGNILRSLAKKINSNYFDFLHLKQGKVEKYTGYCRGYGESGTWSPHQPEKAIRKSLLTQEQIVELERYRKFLYSSLLDVIISKIGNDYLDKRVG